MVSPVKRHEHTHPEKEREELRLRLRKIAGQLNAIDRMLHDDRDCAEVLMQLVSARRGIKSLAEKLIHYICSIVLNTHVISRKRKPNCANCCRFWSDTWSDLAWELFLPHA